MQIYNNAVSHNLLRTEEVKPSNRVNTIEITLKYKTININNILCIKITTLSRNGMLININDTIVCKVIILRDALRDTTMFVTFLSNI